MKSLHWLVVGVMVVGLTLAACVTAPTPAAQPGQAETVEEKQEVAATEEPAVEEPAQEETAEKVFRYHFGSDYGGARLDPNVTFNLLASNLFASLTILNHEGQVVAGEGAARSWDISDDGLTYTFHLYDDMKWSDG